MTLDNELQVAVLDELAWEPSVTAAHVGVTAQNGIVTLTGHVGTYAEKHAAEDAARRVFGVKAVAGDIEIRVASDSQRDDADIAEAAIDRLAWDVCVPKDSVVASVEKGWVTLTGQVLWPFQLNAAENDIRNLHGVTGVTNALTLKPHHDTSNIPKSISAAFRRLWPGDHLVHVHSTLGDVSLSGSVHTLEDWMLASSTAWKAPGVTSVRNELAII